jgi:hypothetical protein
MAGTAAAVSGGEPSARRYLAGFVAMMVLGAPWTLASYRKMAQADRAAVALHGDLLPQEPSWRRRLRRSAITLWNCCGLGIVVMAAVGSPNSEGGTTVPAPVGLGWFIITLAAVATTAPLLNLEPSAAHRVEKVSAAAQEIAPISRGLAEDIAIRVRQLEAVRDEVARQRQLKTFVEQHSKGALDLVIDRIEQSFRERLQKEGRRQLIVGAALGAVLGILVNWVSAPLWDVVRHFIR